MEKIRICKKCGKALPETKEYFYTKFIKKVQKEYFLLSCKECMREADRERKRTNYYCATEEQKQNRREYQKRWREEHRERVNELRYQWVAKNSEKARESRRESYKRRRANNPEKFREYDRMWRAKNPEKAMEIDRRCRERYREKHKGDAHIAELSQLRGQRRRALKKNCKADFTKEQWELAQIEFDGMCAYCGRETRLTQDHFVPLSSGGAYTSDNIVPACSWCNTSKNNRDFDEWYTRQTFFSEDRRRHILNYLGKEIAV